MKAEDRTRLIKDLEILKQQDVDIIKELENLLLDLKKDQLSFIQLLSNLKEE